MPQATDLTAGIIARIGRQERQAISRRSKEALAAAKARGVKLGNPCGAAALKRAGKGGVALRAAGASNADSFAEGLRPVIGDIRDSGATTYRAIADELDRHGIMTRRGG